jgi:DNA-binding NarL/FixJ family response regulator
MAEAQKHDQTSQLNGARVLVIEDDYLISMDLEATLVEAGAEIAGACRTVKDALAVAEQNGVAAAILDAKPPSPWPGNSPTTAYPLSFIRGSWRPSTCCGPKILRKPARPQAIVNAVAGVVTQ